MIRRHISPQNRTKKLLPGNWTEVISRPMPAVQADFIAFIKVKSFQGIVKDNGRFKPIDGVLTSKISGLYFMNKMAMESAGVERNPPEPQ
jgi:hypothetical protein